MAPVRRATPAQRRHAAALRRDGALSRLSTITGAVGVATIAAVGILGVYVGKALPGHNAAATTTGGGTSSGTTGPVSGSSGSSGNSGNSGNSGQGAINPPSTPTQSAPAPAPVTSGSS
jgi:hypothetical protein